MELKKCPEPTNPNKKVGFEPNYSQIFEIRAFFYFMCTRPKQRNARLLSNLTDLLNLTLLLNLTHLLKLRFLLILV